MEVSIAESDLGSFSLSKVVGHIMLFTKANATDDNMRPGSYLLVGVAGKGFGKS